MSGHSSRKWDCAKAVVGQLSFRHPESRVLGIKDGVEQSCGSFGPVSTVFDPFTEVADLILGEGHLQTRHDFWVRALP